jgi:exodeoxyribonuclease VII small subunit
MMMNGPGELGGEPKQPRPTFEEAYAKLEAIVRKLEAGEAQLEESLRLFEEGVALTRLCTSLLERAEARISMLVAGEGGGPEVRPWESPASGDAS